MDGKFPQKCKSCFAGGKVETSVLYFCFEGNKEFFDSFSNILIVRFARVDLSDELYLFNDIRLVSLWVEE